MKSEIWGDTRNQKLIKYFIYNGSTVQFSSNTLYQTLCTIAYAPNINNEWMQHYKMFSVIII